MNVMPAASLSLPAPNLPTMMFALARRWGQRPMLRHHREGAWHSVSWAEFARRAASVACGLRALGVSAGDRVLIVSESRPEVPVLETALMAIRAVPVPAYTTNTPADHAHLLRDSGAGSLVQVPDDDRGAFGGQPAAGGRPDPAAATGHHRDAALQSLRRHAHSSVQM